MSRLRRQWWRVYRHTRTVQERGSVVPGITRYGHRFSCAVAAVVDNLHRLGAEQSRIRDHAGAPVLVFGWSFVRASGFTVTCIAHQPRKVGVSLDIEAADARLIDVDLGLRDTHAHKRPKY